ncbi:MAG: hypothetical protein ABIO70_30325 [Pseudomonadota bacterium]
MSPSRFAHRLLTVVPALVAIAVLSLTLVGHDGLLHRHVIKRQLYRVQGQAEDLRLDNEVLRRRIQQLRERRSAVEREAAESLLVGDEGAVIYRFHEDSQRE